MAGVFTARVGKAEISYIVLNMFQSYVNVPESVKLSRTLRTN